MVIKKFNDMVGGWFVGDFVPAAFRTPEFEVCYKLHAKGEGWPKHYHKLATEINLLIRGKIRIQNQVLESGDIFIFDPGEIADPVFLEECELVVVKTPSVVGDKYEV